MIFALSLVDQHHCPMMKYHQRWDILLDAYFAEFDRGDNVQLVLRAFKPKDVKATMNKDGQGR